ncbi:MAG: hypothetical protein JO228_15290 [Xanthobacteraceae bacterium]|nr:hypothetical protein [Xanthobacteraceae bacterium]
MAGTSENLSLLELDVEATRARLAHDLDRLRSSETLTSFKEELFAQASETKDRLVAKTQERLTGVVEDVWEEMKSRAAANPAATLAIGAGIAWRLAQRPPVASALVGLGLISLLRTDPKRPGFGADFVARSADQIGAAKQKATEWTSEGGPLHEAGASVAAVAQNVVRSASESAEAVAETSRGVIKDLGEQAQHVGPMVQDGARAVADRMSTLAAPYPYGHRDTLLLGAAALAMAAAVGIASQRAH